MDLQDLKESGELPFGEDGRLIENEFNIDLRMERTTESEIDGIKVKITIFANAKMLSKQVLQP